jgi:hypothetical protein
VTAAGQRVAKAVGACRFGGGLIAGVGEVDLQRTRSTAAFTCGGIASRSKKICLPDWGDFLALSKRCDQLIGSIYEIMKVR